MKKIQISILALLLGVGLANAAVRSEKNTIRNTNTTTRPQTQTTKSPKTTTARTTLDRTVSTNRNNARTATTARTAKTVSTARSAISGTTARTTAIRTNSARSAIRPARATITMNTAQSNTFGTGYNTCRDAYFTCMDQFCGTADDTYRRCICSTKLPEIQSRERALSQAAEQLQDFKDLNLEVIDKTKAEVKAMLSASTGEFTQSISKDTSGSASQLSGIRDVLSKTKSQSLSTQGKLDIAGDINSIWATTDLMGGANISNLTGEALYNAVHAQCAEMTIDKCPDTATQTMVMTAYGMYIENDCSLLLNNLDDQLTNANSTIRAAEREMNLARLENYNDHNSTSINDCVAKVRSDITSEQACGSDYVHCLDVTGRYLNYTTGEPIYGPDFYKLETQISLSGDVLTNQTNRLLVATLNSKRKFADQSLDTCRDLSDEVWDEFMRQAIAEIYQNQQERVRQVKNDCFEVVTKCYDEQTKSLKDFSNVKDQLLLGQRLELSEEMCQEKLDACSNLYGGGSHGMNELLTAMHDITSQRIANECLTTLQDYARDLCAVPSNDTLHAYPYACRTYTPGEKRYASIHECNLKTQNINNASSTNDTTNDTTNDDILSTYDCPTKIKYTSCNPGYYMTSGNPPTYDGTPKSGNNCTKCPDNSYCEGGTSDKQDAPDSSSLCGTDYVGSLYHKIARYAMQACVRPSESKNTLPTSVLQDINITMDKIRTEMANALSAECERLGGLWIDSIWTDDDGDNLHDTTEQELFKKFYDETSANTKWGFCAVDTKTTDNTTTTTLNCKEGQKYNVTISHGTNEKNHCCPDGTDPKEQTIELVCGEKPTWPQNVNKPKCTTETNCKMRYVSYYTNGDWRNLFDQEDGSSSQTFTDPDATTIISVWSLDE